MSGTIKLTKWIRLYQNSNYKPSTPKQLEKYKEKEKKLIEVLCDFEDNDDYLYKSSLDKK